MRVTLAQRMAQMRSEWSGNPRLRLGAGLIVVILVIYAGMLLADWRSALHAQYQQRTLQLYKVQALAGKDEWLLRAENARTLNKALQAEVPSAATLGLAQAEAQTWMRQLVQAFGPRMTTETHAPAQVPGGPDLWRIPITIRGLVSVRQLQEILRRIESSDRLIVIDSMNIVVVRDAPTVSITAVAYYRVGRQGGATNGTP